METHAYDSFMIYRTGMPFILRDIYFVFSVIGVFCDNMNN